MTHYIDIKVLPDPEFPEPQLLSELFGRLHAALARSSAESVAVAFPGYAERPPTLGSVMRLLGPASALDQLMSRPWLGGLADHVAACAIESVPVQATHRMLRRVQAKSSAERLRRRQIQRHGLSEAEARQRIPNTVEQTLALPYLVLTSTSTGQRFRLFLRLDPEPASPRAGDFNAYGLSTTATIPVF